MASLSFTNIFHKLKNYQTQHNLSGIYQDLTNDLDVDLNEQYLRANRMKWHKTIKDTLTELQNEDSKELKYYFIYLYVKC